MPETVVFSDSYVWTFLGQLAILFIAILAGNVLRTWVPFLKKLYIPAAIIGGFLVLILKQIPLLTPLVENSTMEIITYHCLGLGFAAMALKTAKEEKKVSTVKVVESGAIMAGGYLIQALIGLVISISFFYAGGSFYAAGLILPMGFGQSTGSALSWGSNFEANYGFTGGANFGLAVAAIGFIVGSVFGVIYLNIATRKGLVKPRRALAAEKDRIIIEDPNEIPNSESIDKLTVQICLVALAYAGAYGIMLLLAAVPVQAIGDLAWGLNFLWALVAAFIIKTVMSALKKKGVIKRYYTNNHLMDRISGTMFDAMIAAGIMAIDIEDVIANIWLLIATCVIGTIVTFFYVRAATNHAYKGYAVESFLTNFGTLTGTLSTGMVLLREIDPDFVTPASSNIVLQNIPSIAFLAPLLLSLGFAASSLTNTYIMFAVYLVLFLAYNIFLFRRKIFKKKYANKPEEEWTE
ncbi:MAG TPA: hypothetical protein IAB47_03645 [Candidatus Scatomorpha merdigallinarum]|nr:hypothetical protein [Candidatus Scatomorpha merdigallinarum]